MKSIPGSLFRPLATILLMASLHNVVRAETTEPPAFDQTAFEMQTALQEEALLHAGKLSTLGVLLAKLKAHPNSSPITLPAPVPAKLDPVDLYEKLLASTLVVGLYFHCADCHQMHFQAASGFAVGEGGLVSICAHQLEFDPKKMLQAYPIVIDAAGKVYPVDEIVALDPKADTVLLHAAGGNFPPLPMRGTARVGEPVYCLSHPGNSPFVFTSGMVSRLETVAEQGRALRLVDVSCEYSPGSSGGPITDSAGNVVAQVNQISSQFLPSGDEKHPGPQATVFNLRRATGAVEILRLADPANRPAFTAEPVAAPDDGKTGETAPPTAAATPRKGEDLFIVHGKYVMFTAPSDLPLERDIKSFDDYFKRSSDAKSPLVDWGQPGEANVLSAPNYVPVGFNGVTGYYDLPSASAPRTVETSITRGIDFRMTFHDRAPSTVVMHVDVNDNRTTPAAADNPIKIDTTLTKDAFTLVKLGPPQENQQAWLAIQVDDFAAKGVKMPVQDGKLPADKKVDFKFTAADGREVDTAKMRGKVILVDFWATWCGPCVEALPQIERLYDRYHARGFEVIGINLDSERSAMDKFLKSHVHPWPQSISAPSGQNPLADRFGFHGIPFFLLIDKAGVATIIDARNPDTDDLIESCLKQADAQPGH